MSRGSILAVERHLCRVEKAARARRDAGLASSIGPNGLPRNLPEDPEIDRIMSVEEWEKYCGKDEK